MKITIDLNEAQVHMLKQFADVYQGERTLDMTNDPIVVVEERGSIITDPSYASEIIYTTEADIKDFNSIEDLLKFYGVEGITASEVHEKLEDECVENSFIDISDDYDIRVGKFYVHYVWNPVAYFLTRKEADNYRKYQSHNLRKSRTFTRNCGYANKGDLPILKELLLRIGKQI